MTDTDEIVKVDQIRTYRAWWPAAVLLPDKSVWHRVRAYATTAGLLVYRRPPGEITERWGQVTPDWFSPIDWAATPRPSSRDLPGTAADLHTEAGLVVITYVGGCGCGTAIKAWRPLFSTRVSPWPARA